MVIRSTAFLARKQLLPSMMKIKVTTHKPLMCKVWNYWIEGTGSL